jgi:hypothetical protein
MAAALGSELEEALRRLVRQLIREELGLVDGKPGDPADAGDDDIAQLAVQRAARLRGARSGPKR